MTPRERVRAAYNHKEPDRVPINIGGVAQKWTNKVYYLVKEKLNITDAYEREKDLDELGNVIHYHPKALEYFRADNRELQINRLPPVRTFEDGSWEHELGMKLKYSSNQETVNFISQPLKDATIEDIKKYDWPDPKDPMRVEGLREEAKRLYETTDYAVCAYKATLLGMFDCAWTMRGMEQFLLDMMMNKELANVLMDRILEYTLGCYEAMLAEVGEFVDLVQFNDDLGTQANLLISPTTYREFVKPRHEILIQLIRKMAPDAKILLHCCGSVDKIIPDFIELGIDVINPVQPRAVGMDTYRLKREFGKDICFQGGIDLQVAMQGTVEDVETEVKERIRSLAPGGGYVLSTANNIASDTPIENVFALYDFAHKYGAYPIDL